MSLYNTPKPQTKGGNINGGSPIINCRAGNDASDTFTLDKLTVRYKKTTD
jgi:hypothetical protein